MACRRRAYTIVELLIVIGIIAILIGVLRLAHLLPLSPWLTLAAGVVLCVLAYRVGQQSRGALLASIWLIGIAALVHVISGFMMEASGEDPLTLGMAAVEGGIFISLIFVFRRVPSQS